MSLSTLNIKFYANVMFVIKSYFHEQNFNHFPLELIKIIFNLIIKLLSNIELHQNNNGVTICANGKVFIHGNFNDHRDYYLSEKINRFSNHRDNKECFTNCNCSNYLYRGEHFESCKYFDYLDNDKYFVECEYKRVKNIRIVNINNCECFFALTFDGKLFAKGSNFLGSLGVGCEESKIHIPQRIIFPNAVNIESIEFCGNRCFATGGGKLFTWGYDEYENKILCSPVQVNFDDNNVIIESVKCGIQHALILTKNGDVYVWGDNTYYQLGFDDIEDTNVVIKNPHLCDVLSISCGYNHSCVLTKCGTYFFGDNYYEQCGIKKIPYVDQISRTLLNITDLKSVYCNKYSTFLVMDDGYTYCAGDATEKHKTDTACINNTTFYKTNMLRVEKIACYDNNAIFVTSDAKIYFQHYNSLFL